jgi:hypothetical protein
MKAFLLTHHQSLNWYFAQEQVAGELLPLVPVLSEVKSCDFLPLGRSSIGSKNTLKTDRTLFLFSALPF